MSHGLSVTSKDGTTIAFERTGNGPALILVASALQRLVEWSDNHTVAKSLRRKGSTMERFVTSLGEAL